ncbi:ABC transporter ATP-binding protein [Natrarchaeobius chitinivorans]|nr:ABC transporter ATP-binding protein [Natrarchaeobius chitinivorans]
MALLEVENLCTEFRTKDGTVTAVDDVSFTIDKGERIGVVGESGAGKSVTGLSILQLVEYPGVITDDSSIRLNGEDLLAKSEDEMASIRGNEIAWIPQDPLSSLNPTSTIGEQIVETMRIHGYGDDENDRRQRAISLLADVGIPDAANRFDDYPSEYSGGMRQRVLIAMALSCEPSLIIADEPTTALDVSTQAQIVNLLRDVTSNDTALMVITHELGLVAELCERVMVLYAGTVAEKSDVAGIFDDPKHPYTKNLLKCSPHLTMGEELNTIPGSMPVGSERPSGCQFHPRCSEAMEECSVVEPELLPDGDGGEVACLLHTDQEYNMKVDQP